MANINICPPSACYCVEKILEISQGQGNHKTYKVQWAPSWVSEVNLMGCDALIQQFLGQKESIVDPFKSTHNEVKQEVEQSEIESAHDKINIFTVQVEGDGPQTEEHEERMVCNVIKVEEDESPTGSHQVVNQEITEVQNTATFDDSEDHHEIHSTSTKNNSSIDNRNECYVSTRFNDYHHEEKPNMDIEIELEYVASENDVPRTTDKRLVSNNTNIDFVNAKSTAALLQKNMKNMAKERQNIESSLTKNNQPILLHPCKNLASSTVLPSSISHRKASYVSTSNDSSVSSTSTNIPNIRTYSSSNPALTTVNNVRIVQNKKGSDNETCSRTSACTMNVADSSFKHPDVNYSADKSNSGGSTLVSNYDRHSTTCGTCKSTTNSNSDVRYVTSSEKTLITQRYTHGTTIAISEIRATESVNLESHSDDSMVGTKTLEIPYLCQSCNINFSSKHSYEKHKATHNARFSCKFCLRVYHSQDSLDRHVSLHNTGVWPHACDVCGRKFKGVNSLNIHKRRTHTVERPFQCSLCSKMFFIKGDLQKHIRCHTGERPYGCRNCDKRFKTSSNLMRHQRRCLKEGIHS